MESWRSDPEAVPAVVFATAVRYRLQCMREEAPGRSVELRVPPFGAVQIVEGSSHTRGTPPAVVEIDPQSWLELCEGLTTWAELVEVGHLSASGERSDIRDLFPLRGLG